MNSFFGYNLKEDENNVGNCIQKLALLLNKGHLGLVLGAGASIALGLPSWQRLVIDCANELNPGSMSKPAEEYNITELKEFSEKIKIASGSQNNYLKLVKKHLYKNVNLDFKLAQKEILIAISSLIVGKNRGTVTDIITYNFDSILEWYIDAVGLKVNNVSINHLDSLPSDINVTHLHGYIPSGIEYGEISKDIIFSKTEFEDRITAYSYWKDFMNDFFRRHVFLAVGLSAKTIIDDILPHLRALSRDWYESKEKIDRNYPYGFAILTNCSTDDIGQLVKDGIIPCVISDKDQIPSFIFEIAKTARR